MTDELYENCKREYDKYFEDPNLRGKIRLWDQDGCRGREVQISNPIRDLSNIGYDEKINSMVIPPEFGSVYIAGGNDLSREIVHLGRNKRILTNLDGSNSKRGNLYQDEVSSIFFDKIDYWPSDPNAQSREVQGWNMPFGDLSYVSGPLKDINRNSCIRDCESNTNCKVSLFRERKEGNTTVGDCWLKNEYNPLVRDPEMNMFIKNAPSNIVLPPVQLRSYDRDYEGHAIHNQVVENINDCEMLCWNRNDCIVSVFREGDKKCFIKNNLGRNLRSPGHISTVKGPLIDKQPYKHPISIIQSQPIAFSGFDLKSAYTGSTTICKQWCEDTEKCGASSYNNDTGECTLLRNDVNEEGARSNNVGNSRIQIRGLSDKPFTLDDIKDACCMGGNTHDNKMISKERCGRFSINNDQSASDACRLRMANICKVRGPFSIMKAGNATQAANFNPCFDWCDKNPAACDKVKFEYCNEELKKPQAERDPLCNCLNYNDDPEFQAIKARYQSSLNKPNPAGGYKKDCLVPACSQKTDRYDVLIDSDTIIAKRTTSCPPIVTIDNSIQVNGNNNILSNISQSGTVSLQFTTNTYYDNPESAPTPALTPPRPNDPTYTGAGAPPIVISDDASKLSEGPLRSDNSQSSAPNPTTTDPESGTANSGSATTDSESGSNDQKIMGINKKIFIFIIIIVFVVLVATIAFFSDGGASSYEQDYYEPPPQYNQQGPPTLNPKYL